MSKAQTESESNYSNATHSTLQKSETLKRKYVKRPTITVETDSLPVPEPATRQINVIEIDETETEDAAPVPTKIEITEASDKVAASDEVSTPNKVATSDEVTTPAETATPTEATPSEQTLPEEPLRSIVQSAPSSQIIERQEAIVINVPATPAAIDSPTPASTAPLPAADPITVQPEAEVPPLTPRELKNEATKKALDDLAQQKEEAFIAEVENIEKTERNFNQTEKQTSKSPLAESFKKERKHSSLGKFILAFATSAACIGILGYFVSLNLPSISVRVAAMQTGIEASYPSYIPRDYQLSGVSTGNENTVTLNFTGPDSASFNIVEEKSSWDSNALLNNYVKEKWGEDYTAIREQGVTLYIHNSDATWVNGGILYKLTTKSSSLTKKQLKNIALSL